jgi:integrase
MKRYCAETAGLKSGSLANYHSAVRQFSLYLHAVAPQSEVLPKRLRPRQPRQIRFYPLSLAQIGSLMTESSILSRGKGIHSHCIRFLIGLLYSTGLRINEALTLNLRDVDTSNSTIFIRRGKFRKERIVPISPSTLNAMKEWLELRSHYAGSGALSAIFIGKCNKRLSYQQASSAFRCLCRRCGMDGDPPPRLHDLRHNYACRCIALWREKEQDINALLPVLSNAMGHVDFSTTQVYIHIDAAALQQASAKFNTYNTHTLENSK